MKEIKFLSPLVIFTPSLLGCKEDLPDPSQSGANVVAGKVNGKAWIADLIF
jgi:hypothetical protein